MGENKKNIVPDWILEAAYALRPPGRENVSSWAERNRYLMGKNNNFKGKWSNSLTPYLVDIMDSFNNAEVEEISIVKSTQVGGTEVILNCLGCIIDQDPGPAMIVYPTDKVANKISEERIIPMLIGSPILRKHYDVTSKMSYLECDEMNISISGANSPSDLASSSIRYLFMDEVDKFPEQSGKESSPRELAKERTRIFKNKKKIISASTPTVEDGPIWRDWQNADTKYEYYVQCPECKEWFIFSKEHLKYDNKSPESARKTAVYVCKHCGNVIENHQKRSLIENGEWKQVYTNGSLKHVAYHLTAFLSPWISFGEIAEKFEVSKRDPIELMNFVNSWLAEAFKDVENTMNAEFLIKKRESGYKQFEVPSETILLTGGVDVQKDCFYYSIRAWENNMTSYNVCHGKVFTWQEIWNVMNNSYFDKNGKDYIVNLACIDSGDQTDDVYNFCLVNSEWAKAVKGASTKLTSKYRESIVDRPTSKTHGMTFYLVDTNYYKDVIFSRITRDRDNGGWYLHTNTDGEYAEMITSEHKVRRKYHGYLTSVWELKAQGRDNHYLDTEVYAALAADLCGIRTMYANNAIQNQSTIQAYQNEPSTNTDKPISHYNNNKSHYIQKKGWFKK